MNRLTIRGFFFRTYRGYRKIPKISPGAYIFQRPFLRGLFLGGLIYGAGNLRLKVDWASLTVGSKFTVFVLFFFVFESNFPITSPGGLIFGEAILRRVFYVTGLGGLYLEGLIFGVLRYCLWDIALMSGVSYGLSARSRLG